MIKQEKNFPTHFIYELGSMRVSSRTAMTKQQVWDRVMEAIDLPHPDAMDYPLMIMSAKGIKAKRTVDEVVFIGME